MAILPINYSEKIIMQTVEQIEKDFLSFGISLSVKKEDISTYKSLFHELQFIVGGLLKNNYNQLISLPQIRNTFMKMI